MNIKKGPIYLIVLILCKSLYILYTSEVIAGPPAPLQCSGPTDRVKVTVKQGIQPTIYLYKVVNLSNSPIFSFSLGDSDQQEMRIDTDTVPKSVSAPLGWKGSHYFGHESQYMSISWSTNDKNKHILPNKSLEGFVIEMPTVWEPINKFPFTVLLFGGDCLWGKVTIE